MPPFYVSIEKDYFKDYGIDVTPTELKKLWVEIYRIIKPGGHLRICMPDYYSPYVKMRSMTDRDGRIVFDGGGGGTYDQNGISNDGQVYFATYDSLNVILDKSKFQNIDWLCYRTKEETLHKKNIDYKKGYLKRVNNEEDKNDYCLVVDCIKEI